MDDMTFDQKLSVLKKFLEEDKQKRNKKEKLSDDDLEKKKTDKDNFRKEPIQKDVQKIMKKPDEKEKSYPQKMTNYKEDKTLRFNGLYDIETEFHVIVQIDKKRLEYLKSVDQFEEIVEDFHLLVLRNKENRFVFPTTKISLLQHEIDKIRFWKNDKTPLKLTNQGDASYVLLRKVINTEFNRILETLFKKGTYNIDSVVIGKEYTLNKFMAYVQISNPIEKCKSVRLNSKKAKFKKDRYKVQTVKIDELIDMAVKYSVDLSNIRKDYSNNPFSVVLMLYLAEVTLREDLDGKL